MLHRMKIAGEYQRKAIRALFPESMGEHLDVIEKELKMMVMEVATELLKEYRSEEVNKNKDNGYGQCPKQMSKVKKVDIL